MFPQLISHPLELVSTTQLVALGTVVYTGQDQARKGYRMVSFPTSTATTSGILLTSAAAPANSTALALPTTNTTAQLSVGSTQLLVTNGVTAVTANQFQDGMLEVLGTNGTGQAYRIAGNSGAANGGAITVLLQEPLRNLVALANGTNTVNLRVNMSALPVAQTTQALPIGVTIMPIASNTLVQYGWVQTFGEAYVSATSATKGQPLSQDLAGTAGFFKNAAAATDAPIAIAKESAVSNLASVQLLLM
jgi:hypothetical protein